MEKSKFLCKPFDEAHARAGAPYCNANGDATQVMKWDARGGCKLIGIQSSKLRDWASEWHPSQLVMLPLGYTDDGKPVWVGDLIIAPGKAEPRGAEPMQRIFSGFTWPAPAKVYPETLISFGQFHSIVNRTAPGYDAEFKAVANAAIRHAIDAGQVILPEDAKRADAALCKAENALEAIGWRLKDGEWYNAYSRHFYGEIGGIHMTGEKTHFKAVSDLCDMRDARPARNMAIAQAVLAAVTNARFTIPGEDGIDLAAIIASVKP